MNAITLEGKGFKVQSTMTDNEVAELLGDSECSFALSLADQHREGRIWSGNQRAWAHRLAAEMLGKRNAVRQGEQVVAAPSRLFDMFARAGGRAKLSFNVAGVSMVLSMAGESSRNAGCLYVKGNSEYWGKITPAGDFIPSRDCSQNAGVLLRELLADPDTAIATYGKRTGHCCCCNRDLTDERSLFVGYGPVCAERWGLPWGERPAAASE